MHHKEELIGRAQQAVGQEARGLDGTDGFFDARADGRWTRGQASGVAGHHPVRELKQRRVNL